MAYVIAEPCIGQKDNSCVEVCPVDCIHPTPDEPDYEGVEQLTSIRMSASTATPASRRARLTPASPRTNSLKSGRSTPRSTRSTSRHRRVGSARVARHTGDDETLLRRRHRPQARGCLQDPRCRTEAQARSRGPFAEAGRADPGCRLRAWLLLGRVGGRGGSRRRGYGCRSQRGHARLCRGEDPGPR